MHRRGRRRPRRNRREAEVRACGCGQATAPFEPAFFNPDDLTQVPGVVGRLIDWIVKSALYPNRTLALGARLSQSAR